MITRLAVVFIALWFLLNFCQIFSSSSCDSCINVLDMAACWCAFCASLHPDCRIICICLFLHFTMNLVTQCAPLVASIRHGASLVQPQVTLNCVHSSVGDEAYNCIPLHGSECTDRHGLSNTRLHLLFSQAAPLRSSLTSHLIVGSHGGRSLQLFPKMYYYASSTLRSETTLPLKNSMYVKSNHTM